MGLINDRMKDYEDVAKGESTSRVIKQAEKRKGKGKDKTMPTGSGGTAKHAYKHGGPVRKCRASRS